MNKLDDSTWVPLGLAIVTIGGAAMWITSISINVEASQDKLNQLQTKQDQYFEAVHAMQSDLAVIKERVESIDKKTRGTYGR